MTTFLPSNPTSVSVGPREFTSEVHTAWPSAAAPRLAGSGRGGLGPRWSFHCPRPALVTPMLFADRPTQALLYPRASPAQRIQLTHRVMGKGVPRKYSSSYISFYAYPTSIAIRRCV